MHSAVTTVLQVHEKEETGDILLFLTGREEIESVQRVLQRCRGLFPPDWRDLEVCPLYAALPTHEQQKVFQETQEVGVDACLSPCLNTGGGCGCMSVTLLKHRRWVWMHVCHLA